MKKKILLVASMVACLMCLFAISVFAENNIIKLDTLPTLEQIHANPSKYVSHLDAFDGNSYGELDSTSVVVLSDNAETPTYYVYPAYYYVQSTSNDVYSHLDVLNAAISAADPDAFAGYKANSSTWGRGGCVYLVRYEVPTYVTTIAAKAKFEGSTNLVEVYFPTHTVTDEETGEQKEVTYVTSVSGENLFSSCSKLEYIHNMGKLPAGVVQGNNSGFYNCSKLREVEIPEGVVTIPIYCFTNCSSLKEIVMPNSVVNVCKQAFAKCSSLETVRFSANFTTFPRVNRDYEIFMSSNNLKYVYLPAAFTSSLEAVEKDYQNIFNSSSAKTVYFITADYDKAVEIQNLFKATKANANIAGADMEAYDPDVDYTNYADSLTRSVIVYNYDYCEAYYGGKHIMSSEPSVKLNSYFENINVAYGCTRQGCNYSDVKENISALFANKGYSVKTYGDSLGIVQSYKVNTDAMKLYKTYVPTFDFGILAAINPGTGEFKPLPSDDGVVDIKFDNMANDYIEVIITGIPEDKMDALLVCCVYITDDDGITYIDNGVENDSVTGVSYNSLAE